ncbi:glycosyltransferase [Vibrio fluvialis]|nr:glycosyltransferase [Vibrio fluvialis]
MSCKKSVAVLMSVYHGDKPQYVNKSIDSVLEQRTVNVFIIIQVDGPIGSELRETLMRYQHYSNIVLEFHSENLGLAHRLNESIDIALSNDFDYIERMDADDISLPDRLGKQVEFLENNKSVSILGTDVTEINEDGNNLFYKKMFYTHEDILRNVIKKCPFNHPTVMFRRSVFEEGYRYKSKLKNTQDYYLWIDLLAGGKIFANLNESLLLFRVSNDFHSRRGLKKAINDWNSRIYAFKKLDVLSPSNVIHSVLLFFLRLAPGTLKKMAYKYLR